MVISRVAVFQMSNNITQFIRKYWLWFIRIAVLWWILSALSPVTHRVLPVPPQTVQTQKPQLCVHTDLINEVDEWKIQHTLELVREMGAPTIVEFFPWAYIEAQEGHYNWQQTDRIVKHTEQQGLRIIARMGLVPTWAKPDDTTLNYIPEESFADFADFVADFAERYAGRIDHLIIWNEPNLAFEWGYQEVEPERYVRMLQAIYERAHAANPDVVILAGALAPTLEPEGSPNGLNDLLYLEALYEAGAADYFDALAVHTYGFTEPAQAEPGADKLNFRRAELLHDIMQRYNDGEKPVYITESGWNDNARWTMGVRPSQRIAYTLDGLEWAEDHWPWMQSLCIWLFRYTRPAGNHRDNFTLVTSEFQIKPIYYALQAYAGGDEHDEALWLPAPDG